MSHKIWYNPDKLKAISEAAPFLDLLNSEYVDGSETNSWSGFTLIQKLSDDEVEKLHELQNEKLFLIMPI